ncbi:MAG: hypothetical protein H0X29_00070 [Parachlamydiaceae bacterium]|nr:hypothetical protein [Parachlamydiaceae bacterium]
MTFQDQYIELLKLTRVYLQQEYNMNDRLLADGETYTYFREFVAQKAALNSSRSKSSLSSPPIPPPIPLPSPIAPVITPLAAIPPIHAPPKKELPLEKLKNEEPAIKPALVDNISSFNPEPGSKAESNVKTRSIFVRELPSALETVDLSDLRKIMAEKVSSVRFSDAIPSDNEAKKKASDWEQDQLSQVIILIFNESPRHMFFLENLRFALEVQGWSARIAKGTEVEKSKGWGSLFASNALHLIVATSGDIEASVELKKLYRETSHSAQYTLGGVPLLLLADPAIYIAEPNLKPVLWKSLKELLAKPS